MIPRLASSKAMWARISKRFKVRNMFFFWNRLERHSPESPMSIKIAFSDPKFPEKRSESRRVDLTI